MAVAGIGAPDYKNLVEVRGAGDPGYLSTSKMLTEVGLALLLDVEASPRVAS